jgi:pSer/pThr/pTyr-binding forkhead associated (FHA) protein
MNHPNVSRGFLALLSGKAAAARRAELEGDLPRAARLWAEADRADEAARVTLVRADGATDSAERLRLYVQAVALAPEGSGVRDVARRKRALLAVAIAREGATSAAARLDLAFAAQELEALGAAAEAAEAYALAGDTEGQARALVQGGDIEQLEDVLERDHLESRTARRRHDAHAEIERLLGTGRRREALARAEAWVAESPEDIAAADQLKALRARRVTGPTVLVELNGVRIRLVLGDDVVIGRVEGAITIASHAVSRRHLAIARAGGAIVARDLSSRNGTELRGMPIAGDIPVGTGEGTELKLGGEVPVRVGPSADLPGSVAIDVGGARYVAPLGVARLGIGAWKLETSGDGWPELVTDEGPAAYLGETRIEARTPLLVGDAVARSPGEPSVLRVA